MDKYQEALDRIKNKKAIIDGEKMTIGTAYCNTFPILQELINNYAKYKRAFEILKDYNNLPPLEEFRYSEHENCYFAEVEEDYYNCGELETEIIHYVLEKEEYELLEELMKGEEIR